MKLDSANRALVATLFVLLGLLAMRLGQQALQAPQQLTVQLDPQQVASIGIGEPGRYLRLDRSETGWDVTFPEEAAGPADRGAVEQLLSSWTDFSTSYLAVNEAPIAAMKPVGITRGSELRLRFEDAQGNKMHSLEFGNRVADGQRYVRRESDRAVYVGTVAREDLLTADPARWLDRTALSTVADRQVAFGIRNRHGEQSYERRDGVWVGASGEAVRDRAVTQLVRAGVDLIRAAPLSPADREAATEEARRPRITIWWADAGGIRQVVNLCGPGPDGRVYMHRDTAALFLVSEDELRRFDLAPAALAPR